MLADNVRFPVEIAGRDPQAPAYEPAVVIMTFYDCELVGNQAEYLGSRRRLSFVAHRVADLANNICNIYMA